MKRELHTIRYSFSPSEIAQKSTQLAETCGQKAELIQEKKSVMSDYKAKIDAKDSVISLLSSHITNGYEINDTSTRVSFTILERWKILTVNSTCSTKNSFQ